MGEKGKGRGGKIRGWKKQAQNVWESQSKKMRIGQKTRRGYPVQLVSKTTGKTRTVFKSTKKEAERFAAEWRRKLK